MIGGRVVVEDGSGRARVWEGESHDLPAGAVPGTVFAADDGALACVVRDGDELRAVTLADGRVIARRAVPDLPRIQRAACDGACVMLACDDALVRVLLGDGEVLRTEVASHEPEILEIRVLARGRFLVRFHHVAMDMYPTDDARVYDHALEAEWRPGLGPQVELHGRIARVVREDGRPLPDLAGHEHDVCAYAWVDTSTLVTADTSGRVMRWPLVFETGAAHGAPVGQVKLVGDDSVSVASTETKRWHDGALVETVPTVPVAYPSYPLYDGFPVHVIELATGRARVLPRAYQGIVSAAAPPIAHRGHLIVVYYTAPARVFELSTLRVVAERVLHENGTAWTSLAPDGRLHSAGYADGTMAAWDPIELVEKKRWKAAPPVVSERAPSPRAADFGLDIAFETGGWLVGWSRALLVGTAGMTHEVRNRDAAHDFLSAGDRVWLMCKDGRLGCVAMDGAWELLATIAGGRALTRVFPSLVAVRAETGGLVYVTSSGKVAARVEPFAPAWHVLHAFAETAAICAAGDAVRAAWLPGDGVFELRDPRVTSPATALAIAPPFAASLHGGRVVRWDLRARACTGVWSSDTAITAVDVRADGLVMYGDAGGRVAWTR